jgi:hypothetical protein
MSEEVAWGTKRDIDGRMRVFYDGYWVKAYETPADTLIAKKWLIEALTRRLFNHVEHGLNVPGTRLAEAEHAYATETDPSRRRVKGAMLAGAHFNRAVGIFTRLVDIQALGVEIHPDDALMRQCGDHLQHALELGKMVLHRTGEEGIDELWGEPFKAFAFPIEAVYVSRYLKIAQTMRDIDAIAVELARALSSMRKFARVLPLIDAFAVAAKAKCETLRTDPDIFEVWTSFVVSAEELCGFAPSVANLSPAEREIVSLALTLIVDAKELVSSVTRARVPMPKSTAALIERCHQFRSVVPPRDRKSAAEQEEERAS